MVLHHQVHGFSSSRH